MKPGERCNSLWPSSVAALGFMAGLLLLLPTGAGAVAITPDVFTDGIAINNNCTLREAVQAANKNIVIDDCAAGSADQADTIFLGSGTYLLTTTGDLEDMNLTGDLDVTTGGDLRIRGAGRAATVIDSNMDDRVIDSTGFAALTLWDLTMTANSDRQLGGGVVRSDSTLILDNVIAENGEAQFGGGVYCSHCRATIRDSIIRDNQSTTNSTGFPNVAARGGGVAVLSGTAEITNTLVDDNESVANDSQALGGGLHIHDSEVVIKGSTLSGNLVRSSTNTSAPSSVRQGAGVYASGSEVSIVNSTISNNVASSTGTPSTGGGLFVQGDSSVAINASTVAANVATAGTGIAAGGGKARVGGSIVTSASPGPNCFESGGTVVTRGYNVLAPAPVGCMDGNMSAKDELADPEIGFAANQGGPTPTFALPSTSSAVNLVPKKKCEPAGKTDQRGAERPAGRACDAGSYERTRCFGELVGAGFEFGTPGNDLLFGFGAADGFAPSAGADKINAGEGEDLICAGSGADTLKGEEGNDKLDGGKGEDDCDGGPGNDTGVRCEKKKSL